MRLGDAPSLAGKTLTTEFEGEKLTLVFGEDGEATATVSDGDLGEGMEARYEQDGQRVRIEFDDNYLQGSYDGENLVVGYDLVAGEMTYVVNCDF
jgi:hypothetical protein